MRTLVMPARLAPTMSFAMVSPTNTASFGETPARSQATWEDFNLRLSDTDFTGNCQRFDTFAETKVSDFRKLAVGVFIMGTVCDDTDMVCVEFLKDRDIVVKT